MLQRQVGHQNDLSGGGHGEGQHGHLLKAGHLPAGALEDGGKPDTQLGSDGNDHRGQKPAGQRAVRIQLVAQQGRYHQHHRPDAGVENRQNDQALPGEPPLERGLASWQGRLGRSSPCPRPL